MRRAGVLALFLGLSADLAAAATEPPHLIVQIVVDQLRGDLLQRYQKEFSPEGFGYLLSHGINFQNAAHPHANTTTCAGHTTIATGSYPAFHGIVANDWYDTRLKREVNCVEDTASPLLSSARTGTDAPGRSPAHILTSTTSDEIVLANRGRAFGVAFKDRSAIALGGHAGKAFWFDRDHGGLVTSTHYYQSYPEWASAWNAAYQPQAKTWTLLLEKSRYRNTDEPAGTPLDAAFGTGFPHQTGTPQEPGFLKRFATTPFADELTADMAKTLLIAEKLGKTPGKTDYLGISFSATDAIGHQFGPNSLESEDNLLHLDKTLAQFLATLDREVGLHNTLIILSADHGVSNSPDYLRRHGMNVRNPLDEEAITDEVRQTLQARFQLKPEALQAVSLPYVYLDHDLLRSQGLDPQTVSRTLARALQKSVKVDAFKVYALPVPAATDWLSKKVERMGFPERSGDLYVVPHPLQLPEGHNPDTHGTPWRYDSYVPLLFVHPALPVMRVSRQVHTTDIAPTLSALLGITPPSGSVGTPLAEVTRGFAHR